MKNLKTMAMQAALIAAGIVIYNRFIDRRFNII